MLNKSELALSLYEHEAIKFGTYVLKTGLTSPFYVDLRILISYSNVIKQLCDHMQQLLAETGKHNFDLICGVPYTAIPFASYLCVANNYKMIMRRKEAKNYGTKKLIEGKYIKGQKVIIIEDILSSGTSILETVISLKEEGLRVTDVIVVLNREQGGKDNLAKLGINVVSLVTISDVLKALSVAKPDMKAKLDDAKSWLQANFAKIDQKLIDQFEAMSISNQPGSCVASIAQAAVQPFSQRLKNSKNAVFKSVLELMRSKKSNLCISIDETRSKTILDLIKQLKDEAIIFKLHANIIIDFSQDVIDEMKQLAEKHQFLIFEDAKFADIGNVVKLQYKEGPQRIASWAHMVTCHTIAGPGTVKGLQEAISENEKTSGRSGGLLLVAQLSSKDNLISQEYSSRTLEMAHANQDCVIGLIAQKRFDQFLLQLTPGVHLQSSGDSLGQQYVGPEDAVLMRGADIVIVGRGITGATDPVAAAQEYRRRAFAALQAREQPGLFDA